MNRRIDKVKIGVYPFKSTGAIEENLSVITKAVTLGSQVGVRLMVFHECALCGYPPLETQIEQVTKEKIENALQKVSSLAKQYQMFLAVGTIRFEEEKRFNSIVLFDYRGNRRDIYDKTALWGWDCSNYSRGEKPGVFEIDGIKIGFRICFDVRFPESFRELYQESVNLCFVSFSDTENQENPVRYRLLTSFLSTRAMENLMTIVSVNSLSGFPTAPTAVFDQNGTILRETPLGEERLLTYDYQPFETSFGIEGRRVNNQYFLKKLGGLSSRNNFTQK